VQIFLLSFGATKERTRHRVG
jgi:hypothetical protein